MMKLHRSKQGPVGEKEGRFYALDITWNEIFKHSEPWILSGKEIAPLSGYQRVPVEAQEIWASGVTYFRSRVARMEEAHES